MSTDTPSHTILTDDEISAIEALIPKSHPWMTISSEKLSRLLLTLREEREARRKAEFQRSVLFGALETEKMSRQGDIVKIEHLRVRNLDQVNRADRAKDRISELEEALREIARDANDKCIRNFADAALSKGRQS